MSWVTLSRKSILPTTQNLFAAFADEEPRRDRDLHCIMGRGAREYFKLMRAALRKYFLQKFNHRTYLNEYVIVGRIVFSLMAKEGDFEYAQIP